MWWSKKKKELFKQICNTYSILCMKNKSKVWAQHQFSVHSPVFCRFRQKQDCFCRTRNNQNQSHPVNVHSVINQYRISCSGSFSKCLYSPHYCFLISVHSRICLNVRFNFQRNTKMSFFKHFYASFKFINRYFIADLQFLDSWDSSGNTIDFSIPAGYQEPFLHIL